MTAQQTLKQFGMPLALALGALALGVYQLGNTGFWGDEYGSVMELTVEPGRHLHSIPFFVLFRWWGALGGQSLEWLRLLSALFAAALVPVVYAIGLELTNDRRVGVGMALLAAASAWRVEEGQEVRFYAYFMFTATVLFWGLVRWQRTRHWRDAVLIGVGAVLTATSHLLGVLFVLAGLGFGLPWASRRVRWIVLSVVCVLAVVLTVLPSVLPANWVGQIYTTLAPTQGPARGDYPGPRGASIGTVFKPAYAAYIYLAGTSLYPLDLWVSVPVLLVMMTAVISGLWLWRREAELLLLLAAWTLVPTLLFFGTLDSLSPPDFVSPGAHHVAPLVLGIWVLAGSLALTKRGQWLLGAAVLASLISLGYYYWGDWSLNARKDVDTRAVAEQAATHGCAPDTLLVVDGRMKDPAGVYLPPGCRWVWVYEVPEQFTTTQVTLWYVATTSDKVVVPALQQRLATAGYVVQDRYAYGLGIVETYRRDASPLLADGQLALLWSPPPLGFNSLRLPTPSQTITDTLIYGAVLLHPTLNPTLTVPLPTSAPKFTGLALTSSTFQASGEVGVLTAQLTDGRELTLPVTVGVQTADWAAVGCEQCTVAFSWRKKLDKLGRSAYPGAWDDFQAKGFTVAWRWPASEAVAAVRFQINPATAGQWWVWQVVPLLEP